MLFTNDVELALLAGADLVNTEAGLDGDPDRLTSDAELDAWFHRHAFTGSRRHDAAELEAVRALRPRLRALWETERQEDVVALVNGMLADGGALPRLVRHDGLGWHIHATRDDAPLADRVMVELAMAWTDVLRQDEQERLKVCAADDCDSVLVDLSRNRSKRFCDTGNCGNRMNVRAFRARQQD